MSINRLKWAALISFVMSMAVLLGGGYFALDKVPPYPGKVVGPDGKVLFEKSDIFGGQHVYQKYGLMDHGSVWGHGSQRGMEFSAMTLHLISVAVRDWLAHKEFGKPFDQLDEADKEIVTTRNIREIKTNRYDPGTDTLALTAAQVKALDVVERFWEKTFNQGAPRYGFLPRTVRSKKDRQQIARFFFWTAWATSARRPGTEYSYTNNWPPDRSVGNVPTTETYVWSIAGLLSFMVALAVFVFLVHHYRLWYGKAAGGASLAEKLVDMPLTSSQVRVAKFFLVAVVLLLLQTCVGGLMAHYTIYPSAFWVQLIADYIPYSWAKSWHLQLLTFWFCTTWMGWAIYSGPIFGGLEPRRQGVLVQVLFLIGVIAYTGSLLGEVGGIYGVMGDYWFWLGHQGWEWLEFGRIWQILLILALIFWLLMVYRSMSDHLKRYHKDYQSGLIVFYLLGATVCVSFSTFGLLYGPGTQLTVADYFRWIHLHLWCETAFEFWGLAVISLLLVAMGLASPKEVLGVAYFTVILVFLSLIGTSHHYFWYGGPSYWLALGSVFSSISAVPMFAVVVRGLMEYKSILKRGQDFSYKWPLYFLVAASFWHVLGAGVYGFLINLPIVNFYEHGTYLTMNHAHAASFGTYGMLCIAQLLFAWRGLLDRAHWRDGALKLSFWGLNAGLMLMTLVTLVPVGIMQVWTAFQQGLWVARRAEFFERGTVVALGTIRIIPDLMIILLGVIPLAWFLFKTYPYLKPVGIKEGESVWKHLGVEL